MNHFLDPPSPDDDEMLSAYVDGEATPEEAARIVSDPHLQARLRALQAAATLVAAPVAPVSAAARDAAIGAALAAADGASAHGDQAAPAPVVHLDSRRRKHWALASVAAVVLLVVVAAAHVLLQPSDTATTTALDQSASKAPTSTLGAPTAAEQATTADRAADDAASYVGAFTTASALVSGTRSLLDARSATAPAGAAGAASGTALPFAAPPDCSPADPDRGAVVFDGTATLGGQPVRVLVQEDAAGTQLLSILDERCQLLTAHEL